MRRAATKIFFAVATFIVLCTALATVTLGEPVTIVACRYLLIAMSGALGVAHVIAAFDAWNAHKFARNGIYASGTALFWFGVLISSIWSIIIRNTEEVYPDFAIWARSAPIVVTFLTLFIIAGMGQFLSPGAGESQLLKSNYIRLGLLFGCGIAAAFILWSLQLEP